MGKQLLVLLISCFSILNPVAQDRISCDRVENDRLKVRQIPSSEETVKAYFKGMKGVVYAAIYPPANCPRCEAAINKFYDELKARSKDNQVVLISVFKDSIAAKSYNKNKAYKADRYIYDTDNSYRDFLSFSIGTLHVVYMLKVDVDNGLIMLGLDAEDLSSDFMSEFAGYEGVMEQQRFILAEDFNGGTERLTPEGCDTLMVEEIHKINTPEEISVSEIRYIPYYEGNSLVFNDLLRGSILLFKSDENGALCFIKEVKSDSAENKKYVSVPDWYYNQEKENGTLYHIPLTPVISGEKILVSYSLPNLFVTKEMNGKLLGVGYKNEICMLFRDINGNKQREVMSLSEENPVYYTKHFTFGATDSVLVIPCEKRTWPLGFEKEEYCNNPMMNPFCDQFYNEENAIFRIIDIYTGQTKGFLGNLAEIHRKSKTGYYFTSPQFDSYNGKAIYTDGVSGILHLTRDDNLNETIKTFKAFSVDTNKFPEPDTSKFYMFECIEPYLSPLSREIYDVRLGCCDKLHCILQYGTHNDDWKHLKYTYLEIDMISGRMREYVLPKDGSTLNYGLWRKNGIVKPYMICDDKIVVFGKRE